MSNDFRVILPPKYSVKAPEHKRDHQTDNAVQSSKQQQEHGSHGRHPQDDRQYEHDRVEISGEQEDAAADEIVQAPPLKGVEHPVVHPPEESLAPKPRDKAYEEDAPDTEGECPPGSILDLEA